MNLIPSTILYKEPNQSYCFMMENDGTLLHHKTLLEQYIDHNAACYTLSLFSLRARRPKHETQYSRGRFAALMSIIRSLPGQQLRPMAIIYPAARFCNAVHPGCHHLCMSVIKGDPFTRSAANVSIRKQMLRHGSHNRQLRLCVPCGNSSSSPSPFLSACEGLGLHS